MEDAKPGDHWSTVGSRCGVTMATRGRLQVKKGLNFQGRRPEGDSDPVLIQSSVALAMLGAKERIQERLSQFSFFTAIALLGKEKDALKKKKFTFHRQPPGSYELMSCLPSRRLDNLTRRGTDVSSHRLPPLPFASQLLAG